MKFIYIWNKNIKDIEKLSEVICKCVEYAFDDIDENNITKIDVEQRFDNLDDLKNEIKLSELLKNFDEIKEKNNRNKYIKGS